MSSSVIHSPVSGSLPPSFFSCRIVKIDYYMSPPIKDLDICYSQFRSNAIDKVPVIRIFGATPSGQKTCLHVHGAFPYLFVPCTTADPKEGYLHQLCGSIDHALQVSLGASSKPAQHVFKAVLVKGIPFYGYHKSEELFIKLYLYNPAFIKRLSDLLLAGAVMNTSFQPHEAHIPFPLQFMMDHNLYGMNYIHLAVVKFRIIGEEPPTCTTPHASQSHSSPLSPQSPSSHHSLLYHPSQTHWDVDNLTSDMVLSTPRQSVCELEVDALAADILNRHELTLVSGGYPGLAAIWEEERQRRAALGIDVPLTPPPSQERKEETVHHAEAKFRLQFEQILRERLGSDSNSSDESTSLPENDNLTNCTQSCDIDLHLPDHSEGREEKRAAQQGIDVIVDTTAIEQSMELTQKLSSTSISKSTDVELMNLMLELCETPIHKTQFTQGPQLSQSLGSSQNVGQALIKKMERAHSILSERSLFSNSSSPQGGSPKQTQADAESLPVNTITVDSEDQALDRRAIAPVHGSSVSSMNLIADSSFDTDEAHSDDGMDVVEADTSVFNETEQQSNVEFSEQEHKEEVPKSSQPSLDNIEPDQGVLEKETQCVNKDSDFVSELDLMIPSSRLSSPLPLSPETKELQELVAESFESHRLSQDKSSKAGSADFESDADDIPCAQVGHSQLLQTVSSKGEVGLSDVDPKWNSVLNASFSSSDSSSNKSMVKSVGSAESGSNDVQLEYDMPEIALVHSRTSEDSTLYDMGLQPQRKSVVAPLSQAHQSVSTSVLRSQLLKVCSRCETSPVECEGDGDISLLEDVGSGKSDSEAEETYWTSQFWDDIELHYDDPVSSSFDPNSNQSAGDKEGECSDEIIPQLDGSSRSPRQSTKPTQLDGSSRSPRQSTKPTQLDGSSRSPRQSTKPTQLDGSSRSPRQSTKPTQLDGSSRSPRQSTKPTRRRKTLGTRRRRRPHQKKDSDKNPPGDITASAASTESAEGTAPQTSEDDRTHKRNVRENKAGSPDREVSSLGANKSDVETNDGKETCQSSPQKKDSNRFPDRNSSVLAVDKQSFVDVTQGRINGRKISQSKDSGTAFGRDNAEQSSPSISSKPVSQRLQPSNRTKESRPRLSLKRKRGPPPKSKPCLSLKNTEDDLKYTGHDLKKKAFANTFSLKLERTPLAKMKLYSDGRKRSKSKDGQTDGVAPEEKRAKLTARSRKQRYKSRSELRGSRIIDYTGKFALYSFKRQLKQAMKLSLVSHSSESTGATSATSDASVAEESSSESPRSGSSGLDLNRTIVEESPLREDELEITSNTQSHNENTTKPTDREEHMDSVLEDTFDDLDTSFCSIPESPPFASSPVSNEFKLELQSDISTHCSSSLGSPITSSSQDDTARIQLISESCTSKNPMADQDSNIGVPILKDRSPGYAGQLSSPGKEGSDTDLPCLSQSSEEPLNESFNDFHLAVTSESEDELLDDKRVGESLEVSPVQVCVRTHVTLKRDREREVGDMKMETEDSPSGNSGSQLGRTEFSTHSSQSLVSKSLVSGSVTDYCAKSGSIDTVIVTPAVAPPTAEHLMSTLSMYNLPSDKHKQPFYKRPEDVQHPKEIGGRILRVPSEMAYELKEFQPTYSRNGHSDLSESGLQQMRLVLARSLLGTQLQLVPLCHPPAEGMSRLVCYTVDDFKQNVELRASYLPYQQVIVCPVKPSPSAAKISSTFRKLVSVKDTKQNSSKADSIEIDVPKEENHETSMNSTVSTSTNDPQTLKSGQSPDVAKASSADIRTPTCLRSSTPMVRGEDVIKGKEDVQEKKNEDGSISTPTRKGHSGRKRSDQLPFTPISSGKRETSQLEGPTPNNTYGFKVSQSALPARTDSHQVQYLTCMSIEVHTRTRGYLRPDPDMDPILAIFYFIHNDWPLLHHDCLPESNTRLGVIAIDIKDQTFPTSPLKRSNSSMPQFSETNYLDDCGLSPELEVHYVSSELELLDKLVSLVREIDPDIIMGYEVTMLSWGYCIERAAHLDINLTSKLSRMPKFPGVKQQGGFDENPWMGNASSVQLVGRITLNVWRLMRHEVALNVYSFENVAYHVLHQRMPLFSFNTLTSWYDHPTKLFRYRVVEYYLKRCQGNFQLLDSFNLIGRTSEFARLYGIEFENVLDRGSQYRVESMMLRLAKPENYIAVSPGVQQRARMAAPECLPLILEPESKFYADPVLVLDFQSLYPSMVIAYNYCYSTCLGRVQNLSQFGDYIFGATSLNVPNRVLKELKDSIHISPNGVVYVKSHIRHGIMPRMLKDILGTRIMVKSSMKQHKANKALNRMLDARQLGLKLIANVTYGYTAANFSGRMPCVEIADSIVRKGRETLERAIELVNSTPEWGGRVVYGDTDSLFVLLEGASKEEAFRIGKEITERVTAQNPTPVKLKFEKVYLPCILQTKKRYVGYMYETLDQAEPVFDAKGIETVRRDGCPAVAKILEKSLKMLFTTRDLSLVKQYVQQQCGKLLEGHGNLQEYTFAKEYRGREYYRPGACVPALELAKRGLLVDRRSEPRPAERVPYVIVYGTPGQPLIQLVKKPEELLNNPGLRLNGVYYITKQVLPALDRAFSLLGVDVRQWYDEMPRVLRAPTTSENTKRARGTLGQYFSTMHCPVCHQLTVEGVCAKCKTQPQKVAVTLSVKIKNRERVYSEMANLCKSCVGSLDPDYFNRCVSFDCPVLYRRSRAEIDQASSDHTRTQMCDSLSF